MVGQYDSLSGDVDVSLGSRRKDIAPDTQLVTNTDVDHLSRLISNYSKPSVPGLNFPGVIEAIFVNMIVYCQICTP